MAEKKFDAQVNYGWGLSLNMTGKAPAIAKRIFDTYNDALEYANDFNDSAIPGLQLSVINDADPEKNGIYFVSKTASAIGADDAELVLVNGSEGTGAIQVETYADAIATATGDNLGQIIYVTTETTSGDSTYIAGPYIVTGAGVVSFLSSSTPGETDEVVALKSRVDTIEGRVNDLDAEHENFVAKEEGKGLSTNDYTDDDKAKLDGIAEGAQVNVIEIIKVNGEALTPDENKAVDITIEAPVYNTTINVADGVVENGDNAPTSTAVYDYVETVKTTVNNLIAGLEDKVSAIDTWKLQVLTEDQVGEDGLPKGLTEISHKTIYLAPNKSESTGNIYNEFIYLDGGSWEKLGEFKADFDATDLQNSITELGTKVSAIEDNLTSLTNRIDILEKDVEDIQTKLDTLEDNAEANKVDDVTVDGASIVVDKIAKLTTASSAVINDGVVTTEATGGLMSKADKEKLDSIETMTTADIDDIINS